MNRYSCGKRKQQRQHMLEIQNLNKSYGSGENRAQVLTDIHLEIPEGKICVIFGQSGSGKSTLLNIIGGIESADSGRVVIRGTDITALNRKKLAAFRRDHLGFIFQFYNLIPNLNARENIRVCEHLTRTPLELDPLIERLGLREHQYKFPNQLSGGQQQRCAIARALIKNPSVLLCDEPTGALDSETSREMLILLEQIHRDYGTTILIVTHNEQIREMAHVIVRIRDGRIAERMDNPNVRSAREIDWE